MASESWMELVQATAAITLALVVVFLLRRPFRAWLGAQAAYALWALAPLSLLAVWLPARVQDAETVSITATDHAWTALPASFAAAATPVSPAMALGIWALGAVGLATVLALRQRQFLRRVRRLRGQDHDESDWATPAVTGLLRPRIVLPADFRQRYSEAEQSLVLAHEQRHLRRGDIPAQSLATLLRCLFWFHPLVHRAAMHFRFDQELACDADVIRAFPNSRRTYGDAMLKTQLAEFGLPLGCHWQSVHPLKERIAMLKQPLPGLVRRRSGSILVASLLAVATLSVWAAQPATPAAAPPKHLQVLTDGDVLGRPKYPAQALKDGISGQVMLELLVGDDGKPQEIRIVESEPAGVFDRHALEAAEQWRFNAGRNGARGEKVEGWVRIPVQFTANAPSEGTEVE